MACRVGMSTTPEGRIAHWKREEGCTAGAVIHRNLTYDEATRLEREEAAARGCRQGEGGARISGPVWSVYYMSGCR